MKKQLRVKQPPVESAQIAHTLPRGWSEHTWTKAMSNCNEAKHFIPLSIESKEHRIERARRELNKNKPPTLKEVNSNPLDEA